MVARKNADAAAPSSEVEKPVIEWGKVENVDDALALLAQNGIAIADASKLLGDGAQFLKDKNVLVGQFFVVLDWHFNVDPETNNEYVNVLIMGRDGSKARFNDGSTGVYAQLKKLTEEFDRIAITVSNGLRRSDYTVEINGKPTKASTFYLSA